MQPVRPLQVPGAQVQGLTLGRGIGPQQPQRQARLNRHYHQQRPQAEQAPSAGTTVRQDLGQETRRLLRPIGGPPRGAPPRKRKAVGGDLIARRACLVLTTYRESRPVSPQLFTR